MHVVPLKAHTLSQLWPTAPIHQCSPSTPHDAALNATGGGDGEADGGGGGGGAGGDAGGDGGMGTHGHRREYKCEALLQKEYGFGDGGDD